MKRMVSAALAVALSVSVIYAASTEKTVFTDVPATAYYAAPVEWAVNRGITAGTSATTFSPDATCTNAQILTFLWKSKGSQEPTIQNPFNNITAKDYYYKAALWAYQNGLVDGSVFEADTPCTRSSTVLYLWKLAGKPAAETTGKFMDVASGAVYAQAVSWAVKNGITSGTGENTFSPDKTCTRGQIVTFLLNDDNRINKPTGEDEPIEVDWEEPPVVTYYNEEADINSDGHVEKTEWETWISEHPEDLDQNMMVDDDELAAYESGNEEEIMEYMPLEEVLPYTEEELEEIHAEGKEYVESQGGGLAYEPEEFISTGNAEWDAIFKEAAANPDKISREGKVYDPETGGIYNPNCAIN